MKKIILFSSILCLAFSSGKLTDYRDAYVGYYFSHTYATMLSSTTRTYETTVDTFTIHVTKDVNDSVMQLALKGYTLKAKLVGRELSSYPDTTKYGGTFYGFDSLRFYVGKGHSHVVGYLAKKN